MRMTLSVTLTLLLLAVSSANCSHDPCPVPAKPIPPPPVVIVQPRPPCLLPKLPDPIAFTPTLIEGTADRFVVTQDMLADLAGYTEAMRGWVIAASGCLAQ